MLKHVAKKQLIASMAALAYGDTPCLEAMPFDAADTCGVVWVSWSRTVRKIMLAHPAIFGGFVVDAGSGLGFRDCLLQMVPSTEETSLKFEAQAIRITPTGTGLAVVVPGNHPPAYLLPMCCPAEFVIWLCQIV